MPFQYCGHGNSRVAYSSTEKTLRFTMKFAHKSYSSDDNLKEFDGVLPEWFIPRVYGLLDISVWSQSRRQRVVVGARRYHVAQQVL